MEFSVLKLLSYLVRLRHRNIFYSSGNKKSFSKNVFFSENLQEATTLSQAEISYKNVGMTFDRVSERRREPKKAGKKYFPHSSGKLISSTGSKGNKEVTLKARETCSLYGKSLINQNCVTEKSALVSRPSWKVEKLLVELFWTDQVYRKKRVIQGNDYNLSFLKGPKMSKKYVICFFVFLFSIRL